MTRVDRLTSPPVVGQFYLVPTIFYEWFNPWLYKVTTGGGHKVRHWPVMGAIHNDADRFPLPDEHYHLDPRFIPAWGLKMRPFATPLIQHYERGPMPSIEFRSVRCHRTMPIYPHHDQKQIIGIQQDFAEQQCAHGKGGWICPHRKFSLGSIEPVDGVITCPLHGMKIDAASGRVRKAEA